MTKTVLRWFMRADGIWLGSEGDSISHINTRFLPWFCSNTHMHTHAHAPLGKKRAVWMKQEFRKQTCAVLLTKAALEGSVDLIWITAPCSVRPGTECLVPRCSSWVLRADEAWHVPHHLPSCVGPSSPLGSVFLEDPDLIRVPGTRSSSVVTLSALDSPSLPSAVTSEIN